MKAALTGGPLPERRCIRRAWRPGRDVLFLLTLLASFASFAFLALNPPA